MGEEESVSNTSKKGDGNFRKARGEAKKGELDEQLKEYINEWRKQRAKEEEELKRLKGKRPKTKLPKWFGERPGKKAGEPDSPEDDDEGGADSQLRWKKKKRKRRRKRGRKRKRRKKRKRRRKRRKNKCFLTRLP